MAGAIAVALLVPGTAITSILCFAVSLGAVPVVTGIGVRRWAAKTLGPYFTQSITVCTGQRHEPNDSDRFTS